MKIALGSDHAGYAYKESIKRHLQALGHEVMDFGTDGEAAVDYPDFVGPAAQAVGRGLCERGIVLGGSGNGEAMVANKVPGTRCALCWNDQTATWARQHNDANMLAIGERTVDEATALRLVDIWLATPFEGGRHLARVFKIEHYHSLPATDL